MSEPNGAPEVLRGRGLVSAPNCEPVRVRYRMVIERRPDGAVAHGTLHGSRAGLRPVWLEPEARLRLKDGRRLAISLTDLVDDVAEFESTGPVPDP